MKQEHLWKSAKLTKGLLIVALLCSLFAFLGDATTYPARLEPTTKTELVATNKPTFDRQELASEQSKNVVPKRVSAYRSYSIITLLAYNRLIITQISRICRIPSLITLISKFFQIKTIPASTELPHANDYQFPANPIS